ncbi:MAG: hypothetical protein EOO89_19790 [Pedobacter sp.]|nr:MAG: hypothetical protein EOO89_19790 [Pedobacter sp.]
MKTATETGYFTLVDPVLTNQVGQWVYVEKEYIVPANITQLGLRLDNNGVGTVWFDDIRLHPSKAQMKTYTYDVLAGVTSEGDINNRYTHYLYDELNRLILIRDNDGNVVKKFCYNYSGQTENCTIFFNEPQSGTFTRSCLPGAINTGIQYTVAAGRYVSTVSQAAANQQAVADVNANGQAYVNQVDNLCKYPNAAISQNYQSALCTGGTIPRDYYVYIAAGEIISNTSVAHANSLAQTEAQQRANANGQCITPIYLSYTNNTYNYKYVNMTNNSTSEVFYFDMPGQQAGFVLIPSGTYAVNITDYSYSWSNSYQVGCSYYNGDPLYLPSVLFDIYCYYITAN